MYHKDKKIFFLHIPKTAGRSIEQVLGRHNFVYGTPFGSYIELRENYRFLRKMSLHEDFNKYYKFAFVRNPWSRALSAYFYIQKCSDRGWIHPYGYPNLPKKISFKELVLKYYDFNPHNVWHFGLSQFDILSDSSGCILANFVGKFENLQEDFNYACRKAGIPNCVGTLPHCNKTEHKHYTEYYDDETRQIVAEKYAKDIEHFGYKFGE